MKYRVWNVRRFMKENEVAILADGSLLFLDKEDDLGYVKMDFLDTKVNYSTGLNDKNGKEIFGGDVVKAKFQSGYSNHFADVEQLREVKYNAQKACWSPFDHCHMWVDDYGQPTAIEIMGNIYENPEILKA